MVQLVQVDADDQNNIALTRKQFSDLGPCRLWRHASRFEGAAPQQIRKVFANFHNPRKDYGSNRLFQSDLKEVPEKDAAFAAKPYLQDLLTVTQLVMNSS